MILTMKLISIGFDMDQDISTNPSLLEYYGYILCPGTIYEQWISFTKYSEIIENPNHFSIWVSLQKS